MRIYKAQKLFDKILIKLKLRKEEPIQIRWGAKLHLSNSYIVATIVKDDDECP
jgi:hypothetical protein